MTPSSLPPRDARSRLIDVAMHVFAEHGIADVGTRDLARTAQVSLSAINYHFRTKADLHKAAAQCAAELMAEPLEGLLARPQPPSKDECVQSLVELVDAVAAVMLAPGATRGAATQFGLRELVVSGPGAEIFQKRVLDPVLHHAASLLRVIVPGKFDEAELVIHVTSLFGPITLYRVLHNRSLEVMAERETKALLAVIGDVNRRAIMGLMA